jgi:ADP-ribose pyrophosphatase
MCEKFASAMEKPRWRVRASSYVIDSPFLRLRKDEIELPNGTIVPEYYVRESQGYVVIFAITREREVVLTRQYRYGNDSIGLELPAGSLTDGEDPLACAKRELAEETGYTSRRWEQLLSSPAEPVRSTSVMYAFIAHDAQRTTEQSLDVTEHIDVETLPLERFHEMLRDAAITPVASIATGYAAIDYLRSPKPGGARTTP